MEPDETRIASHTFWVSKYSTRRLNRPRIRNSNHPRRYATVKPVGRSVDGRGERAFDKRNQIGDLLRIDQPLQQRGGAVLKRNLASACAAKALGCEATPCRNATMPCDRVCVGKSAFTVTAAPFVRSDRRKNSPPACCARAASAYEVMA